MTTELLLIPNEVRCPECGSAMMIGPAVSRLIVPNSMYARCHSRHCANAGKLFSFKIPLLVVEEALTEGMTMNREDPDG